MFCCTLGLVINLVNFWKILYCSFGLEADPNLSVINVEIWFSILAEYKDPEFL